ncbi:MAG: Short-chain dehydrogenase [uncultured Sulfurovum sp.]|uniref:Short-chain dehydrogenase n=2 Tax=uncultured Sulfurovum sp. TaxID=269237 RepID=A0A6S6SCM8_9BACT|nr:MAG: Short-chain dehydrogenase [uncultured Sulfurovum sp.]
MSLNVWIIGASQGIGLELAKYYLKHNHSVIISAREIEKYPILSSLKNEYQEQVDFINMDVTNTLSVKLAMQKAWKCYGHLDICIYNAGIYEAMPIDEWNLEHFENMNQVNHMGAIRVLTEIVPLFKEQARGHLVFNASISSYLGLPYGGGYSAPKAALLNFCESIEPELATFNIKVQVINHGFVKTRLTQKNDFNMPQLLEPKEAAVKIYEGVMHSKKFEIKFPWALTRFLTFLQMLPYGISLNLTKKALK